MANCLQLLTTHVADKTGRASNEYSHLSFGWIHWGYHWRFFGKTIQPDLGRPFTQVNAQTAAKAFVEWMVILIEDFDLFLILIFQIEFVTFLKFQI